MSQITRTSWSVMSLLWLIVLIGACVWDSDQLPVVGPAADEPAVPSSSTTTTVRFEIIGATMNFAESRGIGDTTPDSLMAIDVLASGRSFIRGDLSDGVGSIELPKGGLYLIGLFRDGDGAGADAGIRLVGNINMVSVGLDSLPVSLAAADEVDLGIVSLDTENDQYGSTLTADNLTEFTGIDAAVLSGLGGFDRALKKFLNPDINANGIIDEDESLYWMLSSEYLFSYSAEHIDMDTGEIAVPTDTFFVPGRKLAYFNGHAGFGVLPGHGEGELEQVKLHFPEGLTVINENDTEITYLNPRLLQWEGKVYQFDFTTIKEPKPFFGGDYRLEIGSDEYFFSSVYFVNPEEGYDGMLFPIFDYLDDGEYYTAVRYRWKFVQNGVIRDAHPDEVSTIVHYLFIEFHDRADPEETVYHGLQIHDLSSASGEFDVRDKQFSLLTVRPPGMTYGDVSWNQFQFWYDFEG